jgi:thiosulfate reductase/polysulfide reductase chain A
VGKEQVLSRRGFLKLSGATAGGILLSGKLRALTPMPAMAQAQPDSVLYGACDVCGMGCAYVAHLRDGRIIKLTGNPNDQTAEGKLCVKGYSGLRLLYDPDRLKYPLKRTNPERGIGVDPKWVRISWDEALDTIASKLKAVRDSYGPQAIMLVARPGTWTTHFARAIGTPNHVSHDNTCFATHEVIWEATITGKGRKWTVDYEHARYILAFGWDGMGKSKNHWGRAVNRARMSGARLVVLDPRLSITASKADEWIPIKPGTDLAFALAMIHVIISEGLYDHQFIENYTSGLAQLTEAVQEYTPEWAAPICDVPAETIARIAREFATTRPAVVAYHKRDAGGPNYANSWRLSYCYVILDALVGGIDRPGGHIFDRVFKLPDLPDIKDGLGIPAYPDSWKGPRIDGLDQFPLLHSGGKGSFTTLANGILSQKPYPVKAAVISHYNLLAVPNPSLLAEALKTLDFIAVSDVLPSEMAQFADIVIPDLTFFESAGLVPRVYHAMFPQVALREGLPALYEAKGFGAVLLSVLGKMGLKEYVPEGLNGKLIMDEQLKTLGITVEQLRNNGGIFGTEKPLQPATQFGTPSKKIELYSSVLEKEGYDPVPHWAPPRAQASPEYPYHLLIYRKPWERMSQTQNDPVLAEFWPENAALINSATARELGIAEGDRIYVESAMGKIKVRARLTAGIRPDCVAVDHGFGHWSKGYSVAYGKGANDGDLIPAFTVEEQRAAGDPAMGAMMEDVVVRVYRA